MELVLALGVGLGVAIVVQAFPLRSAQARRRITHHADEGARTHPADLSGARPIGLSTPV